ncbi:MAG: cadmium-translocating P-type ATPase [Clostridiales bacterium]|nr:cadmium-translocating P-type ATPase [Clostridiales bacterium]
MTRKQKKNLIRILVSAALLVVLHFLPLSDILENIFGSSDDGAAPILRRAAMIVIYLIPYLIVGLDVIKGAIKKIGTGDFLDEEFLMMIATAGAFAIGDYPEATAVMLFYQVGELFQSIAVGKSRKSIAAMMDICPDTAIVLRDGAEEEVDPSEVEVGETVLVKPGEKVPIDGVISEGSTSLNTAALTGESLPVEAAPGSSVYSGSINLSSAIKVTTTTAYENSTVARILELVENSTDKKASSEKFITKFARIYTPVVVALAVLIAVICAIFTDLGVSGSIYRGLIFLVVSCPCALVVSVPLSFFGGIGAASRRGILVKGSNYLEALSKIDTIVLDKTGTLTEGAFAVEDIHPNQIDADELIDIAALAESRSHHPVAESIVKAHGTHIDASRLGDVEEIAGRGIRAVIDNKEYFVGNGKLMEDVHADFHECHLPGTVVHVACGSEYLGHIIINDVIKKDSKDAVADMRRSGVRDIIMLTGDNEKVAAKVASEVGITNYHAGLLPAQKVEELESILGAKSTRPAASSGSATNNETSASGRASSSVSVASSPARTSGLVAFVGDGINDAPVLTRADVGIAMGALGSDAAIEAADVVLMDDHLSKIPEAIRIGRKTMRIVTENIVFSILVKVAIMVLGALGLVGMRVAIFGDVGVLILAILNSLRALSVRS